MKKFIRLDMKGHWRGQDHVSSLCGMAGEWEGDFERGISCFDLNDKIYALDSLRHYWFEIANIDENRLDNMQVTIFEGEKVGDGSDFEELATCENTIAEFDAKEFMMNIQELYELYRYDDEISEEEYEEKLSQMELF